MVLVWVAGVREWSFLGPVLSGWVIPNAPDVEEDERDAWQGTVRMAPGYQRQTADGYWRVTISPWQMGHDYALVCPD